MQLPGYERSVGPADLPGPRVPLSAGTMLGEAMEKAGREEQGLALQWAHVEQKAQAARDAVTEAGILTRLEAKGNELREAAPAEMGSAYANTVSAALTTQLDTELQAIADARTRDLVKARGLHTVGTYAIQARGAALARYKDATVADALTQVEELTKRGTPEDRDNAVSLIQGLTAHGFFQPAQGDALTGRIRKESIANAFGRALEADPQAAFDAVNQRQGIFADVDDADHQRLVATARNTIEQRKRQEREDITWAQHQEDRAKKEWADAQEQIAQVTMADLLGRARTMPLADVIHEAQVLGPDGTQQLKMHHVENVIQFANSMKTDLDKSDPAALLAIGMDVVGATRAQDLPSVEQIMQAPRVSPTDRLHLIAQRTQQARYFEEHGRGQEDRAYTQWRHKWDLTMGDLHRLTSAEGITDPTLQAKIHAIQSDAFRDLMVYAGDPKKEDPGARWNAMRPMIESALGYDIETSARQYVALLPPGIRTVEDIEARRLAGWYKGKDEDLNRHISLVRGLEAVAERMRQLKVGQDIVDEIKRQRTQKGQPKPGEVETPENWSGGY